MNKAGWMIFSALMVVILLTVLCVRPFSADDGNFQKAGQQALQEREDILLQKQAEIKEHVWQASVDRVVTKDEIVELRHLIDDFQITKKQADKYLSFYKLQTATTLSEEMAAATWRYFHKNLLFKKDHKGELKRFFAIYTGQDVAVQEGFVSFDGGIILITIFTAFLLVCTVAGLVALIRRCNGGAAVFVSMCGILFIMVLLLLLLS